MRISIETPLYNEKRYGKPYIGRLNPNDGRVAVWGTWIGSPGDEGLLEIEAPIGSAVISGQTDGRGNNGHPSYGVVQADGTIKYMTKAAAVKAARAALAT